MSLGEDFSISCTTVFLSCTVCSLSQRLNYNMHIIKKKNNNDKNIYYDRWC